MYKSVGKIKLKLVILFRLKYCKSIFKKSFLKISFFQKEVHAFRLELNGVINRVNQPKGRFNELLFYLH